MIPWQLTDQYVRLSQSVTTPICTGEDIYLKDGFMDLFRNRAVSVIHPDLASSGGILETKKIGDLAQEHSIAMAMHMAGSPISAMANVHGAAATENFMVLENHSVDLPRWNDLVEGLPNPIIKDGYSPVRLHGPFRTSCRKIMTWVTSSAGTRNVGIYQEAPIRSATSSNVPRDTA